ncbi:MAG: hypothetical protein V5A38_02605 [Halolamina sp.]|uniref:hypothetical protein n=1 Tax=Halolamina sp. TaxID=1940283 RepID=UPI002FC37FD0
MSPSETSSMSGWLRTDRTLPAIESLRSALLEPVQAIAFWTAIGLPLVYVPMLATGAVWQNPVAVLAILVLNIVAFVVGHEHNLPESGRSQH